LHVRRLIICITCLKLWAFKFEVEGYLASFDDEAVDDTLDKMFNEPENKTHLDEKKVFDNANEIIIA